MFMYFPFIRCDAQLRYKPGWPVPTWGSDGPVIPPPRCGMWAVLKPQADTVSSLILLFITTTPPAPNERRRMENLLSLEEVCKLLGCNDPKGRMVRNLRSKGKLTGAKFGRRLMFTESSVRHYIEQTFREQNPKIKGRPTNRPGDEVSH